MRFLIARLSALGDVVCTLPAASALKDAFPDCRVVWAVDKRFAGIVECCPDVDEVVLVKPGLRPQTWPRWDAPFDAALDLQGLLKSGLCLARARAKTKLGYHWQREGSWLFSGRVMPDPSSRHVVDQYVDVARAAGGTADRARFALRPRDEDLESVRGKLEGVDRFVVMNAGAGWITKRWPAAFFAETAVWLQSKGWATVLIGGPSDEDRAIAGEVASGAPAVRNLAGQTSVRELVALLSLADGHLGGDTGSSHLAAALGKPAVGLYSITRPERSCPYGQIDRCCYHADSLAAIPPSSAIAKLEEALGC